MSEQPVRAMPRGDSALRSAATTGSVIVLTGERGTGKTTTCHRLAQLSAAHGRVVAGVISPAIFRSGEKVGIEVVSLRSGEARELAWKVQNPRPDQLSWEFCEEALAWGDGVLAATSPCNLLVIDELGPLEMEQGRGFVSAFPLLRRGFFDQAVVVVRPSLIDAFRARLGTEGTIRVVEMPPAGSDAAEDWKGLIRF